MDGESNYRFDDKLPLFKFGLLVRGSFIEKGAAYS